MDNKNRDGELFVAAFSITFTLATLVIAGLWQLAAWLFARPAHMLLVAGILALSCMGCSEFRATGEVSTLVHRTSFAMEVVK